MTVSKHFDKFTKGRDSRLAGKRQYELYKVSSNLSKDKTPVLRNSFRSAMQKSQKRH